MACISAPVIGGALSGVGSLASGALGSSAATQAAQVQANAAEQGQQIQEQELNTVEANLAPYDLQGQSAISALSPLIGTSPGTNPLTAPLTAPFQPTQAQLAQTPGYQFTLGQGLKATQNSYAAQGLASSGAALKGAANYAEGLASTTYQNQFQNYLVQNQQIYNMLQGQIGTGETAAAGQGALGLQGTSNITNLLTGGAAATAGGIIGSTNALTAGLSGAGNAASNTALLTALSGSGLFGTSASGAGFSGGSAAAVTGDYGGGTG